jgi:hypothetical protein
MLGDQPVDEFPAGFQPGEGAGFVGPHQPRIAGDIGRENRRELAFDRPIGGSCHRRPSTVRPGLGQ